MFRLTALILGVLMLGGPVGAGSEVRAPAAGQISDSDRGSDPVIDRTEDELDNLVTAADKAFLLENLGRIDPPERIQELLHYAHRQHQLGGGFHGLIPAPLEGVEALPNPGDENSILESALILAQRREANRTALGEILPTFPFVFHGNPVPDSGDESPAGWSLVLDDSAISGFLEARSDGEITSREALKLAALPTNTEMLGHRRNLGYVPEPLPTQESLAEMIAGAGSADPLDRLWAWIHPWNFFGYADVATGREGYAVFIDELRRHGRRLTDPALSRVAAHAPKDMTYDGVYALTIGCLIRGWVTPEMPGLNIEQVKDDWRFLDRVMAHETFHKIQPHLCPTLSGDAVLEFEDLATADLGDPRQDKLYEILAYTVLEGTANYAAGADGNVDSIDNAHAGSEIFTEFVSRVLEDGDIEAAEELLVQGLRSNGPLYALGYHLSSQIAREEGSHAVGEWLGQGPVAFVLHAEALAAEDGRSQLNTAVLEAVMRLREKIDRIETKE